MPTRNLLIIGLAILAWIGCYARATRLRYASIISHVISDVSNYYVEPIDDRQLFESAMHGLAESLDENSAFIPPVQFDDLRQELDQEFVGVGIEVSKDPVTHHVLVISPLLDSPAYRAGIRAGDQIVSVEHKDTATMQLQDSIKMMKGLPGTQVRMQVMPYGMTVAHEVTLTRQRIAVASLLGDTRNSDGTWNYVLESNPRIGYIRIVNFGENTATEFQAVIKKLDGTVDGLILDVRDNPGGLLLAALEMCNAFIDDGLIVTIRGRDGIISDEHHASPDYKFVPDKLPCVVMVNELSASASEILAACLQDHQRATVVGQRSWGKGTVQRVFELEGGRSALKFTTDTYWRPSGKNIHRSQRSRENNDESGDWGVRPLPEDEVIVELPEHRKVALWRKKRDAVRLADGKVVEGVLDPPPPSNGPPSNEPPSNGPQSGGPPDDKPSENELPSDETSPSPDGPEVAAQVEIEEAVEIEDRQLTRAIERLRSVTQGKNEQQKAAFRWTVRR